MNKRIIFIDYLRGFACLFVLISHLFIRFWFDNVSIAFDVLFKPHKNLISPYLVLFFEKYKIDLGIIGIGIFFLITGFLIPYSIKKTSYRNFLKKKFLRIYPIYLLASIITLFSLLISAWINRITFPYSFLDLIANVLMITDLFNLRALDMVIWTLLITIKYYLFSGLFYIKKPTNFISLTLSTFLFFIITRISSYIYQNLTGNEWYYGFIKTFSYTFIYFIFINIGIIFHNFHNKKWTIQESLFAIIIIGFLFYFAVLSGVTFGFSNHVLISFLISFTLFVLFFFLNRFLPKSHLINLFSSISYPVYLIHRINGYFLLFLLTLIQISPQISLILTLGTVLLLSFITRSLGDYLASSTTTTTTRIS